MTTTKKKRINKGRDTSIFFGYLKGLKGYKPEMRDEIYHGLVESYLIGKYGVNHGRRIGLTELTDVEYEEALADLIRQVNLSTDVDELKKELNEGVVRKRFTHQILEKLGTIGVGTMSGYGEVNRHIQSLPISRGRIIPAFPVKELPGLFKAVCAYCDNILKRQHKEQAAAERN